MTRNAAMLFLSTFNNSDSTLVLAAAIRSVTELTALPFACVITSPGTTIFVNKAGEISWKGKSSVASDEELILEQWEIANLE